MYVPNSHNSSQVQHTLLMYYTRTRRTITNYPVTRTVIHHDHTHSTQLNVSTFPLAHPHFNYKSSLVLSLHWRYCSAALPSIARIKLNSHFLPLITCISGGPPSSRINSKWLWFSINTSFLNRPPSGDSSWMYSPVRYRCTSVDLPELSEPTMPSRSSGTVLAIVHSWLFTKESVNIGRRRKETTWVKWINAFRSK